MKLHIKSFDVHYHMLFVYSYDDYYNDSWCIHIRCLQTCFPGTEANYLSASEVTLKDMSRISQYPVYTKQQKEESTVFCSQYTRMLWYPFCLMESVYLLKELNYTMIYQVSSCRYKMVIRIYQTIKFRNQSHRLLDSMYTLVKITEEGYEIKRK